MFATSWYGGGGIFGGASELSIVSGRGNELGQQFATKIFYITLQCRLKQNHTFWPLGTLLMHLYINTSTYLFL